MKSRSVRLQPAADVAREKREGATQRLAEQQGRVQNAEQQLGELQRYKAEYALQAGGTGMTVSALLNRQQFMDRIDQAIEQQQFEVQRQRRQLDQVRGEWRDAHARERALDSVIDNARNLERKAEDRREQNAIDERMQYPRASMGQRRT
ncbi:MULTISPECIES: flagellar export protein FliJ [Dyella]|uniref:Flagellar FliJ protein n=2 Tax=Dyella TaxID=231454 RepID=A0A4R0YH78_9GAMM|nr:MULTISPECIES: flagellar export protein FliJ [Dyella]TBR37201.1 flagellar export protein FliJ [Dyella terrae]TCI07709.1 flagellar export protein FliJ [Dyella soli]